MDPMLQSQAREWLMMLTMWAFFGYALYLITVTLRRKQRNAMQQHVLDKFASAKDFADFVQSPAGQKYVMSWRLPSNGFIERAPEHRAHTQSFPESAPPIKR